MSLAITSPSFPHNGAIPARHTCDGLNVSPPLAWAGVPAGTKSLALIVDDPDAPDPAAPKMTWVHWVLYNIPTAAHGLTEGVAVKDSPAGTLQVKPSGSELGITPVAVKDSPAGTLQGVNDWQRTGYGGPCPPVGRHRYFFKLYALDILLPDLKHPTKAVLEKAMQGHVLAHSELIGLYQRQ
ncbi:MAG: YbhB/YbcL family Raf kinase inhibitor-like protein [Nitrosomonadales bacterium]|nr:YbhB/YbcL family Raf kinase inhibitor-like protein [Nitrosomonadales bacterium]